MGARSVDVNKTVSLDANTYNVTSSEHIYFVLGGTSVGPVRSPYTFTVSADNTSFRNNGGKTIILTW